MRGLNKGKGPAASIWFEIWGGVVDPGQQNFHFPGKFQLNFDFFRQFPPKNRFFQANFEEILFLKANLIFFDVSTFQAN